MSSLFISLPFLIYCSRSADVHFNLKREWNRNVLLSRWQQKTLHPFGVSGNSLFVQSFFMLRASQTVEFLSLFFPPSQPMKLILEILLLSVPENTKKKKKLKSSADVYTKTFLPSFKKVLELKLMLWLFLLLWLCY